MNLSLFSYVTAINAGLPASFIASGGIEPYTYSVVPGGAGGSINPSTGIYTSPSVLPSSPHQQYDTIQVTDAALNTATQQILVGPPLLLFCEIIQNQMQLPNGRIYIWNQKWIEPKDYNLYIAVSVMHPKPFGNTKRFNGNTFQSEQSINNNDTLQIDALSRGPDAEVRKNEILLALNSDYSESQQDLNSFKIGKLPANSQFTNISKIDGAAIPYRFTISINIQYFEKKLTSVPYFSNFQQPQLLVNP